MIGVYKCQTLSETPFSIVLNNRVKSLAFKEFTSRCEEETIIVTTTKAMCHGEH